MSAEICMQTGEKPVLKWVPKAAIFVDSNYQREVRPHVVQRILKKFDWKKFGCLSLVEHEDGRYSVFDGQHRWAAAKAHPKITEVPASVVSVSSLAEEADAFLGVNRDRTAVTVVDRYHAGITAGDAQMMLVQAVLKKAGCSVVPTAGPAVNSSQTNAVNAIERAIKNYGESAVIKALMTLKAAWTGDKSALSGTAIGALARIYKGNAQIDPERMVNTLRQKSRKQLTGDAEAIRKISGGAAETVICKALCEIYNKGLHKNTISIGVKA